MPDRRTLELGTGVIAAREPGVSGDRIEDQVRDLLVAVIEGLVPGLLGEKVTGEVVFEQDQVAVARGVDLVGPDEQGIGAESHPGSRVFEVLRVGGVGERAQDQGASGAVVLAQHRVELGAPAVGRVGGEADDPQLAAGVHLDVAEYLGAVEAVEGSRGAGQVPRGHVVIPERGRVPLLPRGFPVLGPIGLQSARDPDIPRGAGVRAYVVGVVVVKRVGVSPARYQGPGRAHLINRERVPCRARGAAYRVGVARGVEMDSPLPGLRGARQGNGENQRAAGGELAQAVEVRLRDHLPEIARGVEGDRVAAAVIAAAALAPAAELRGRIGLGAHSRRPGLDDVDAARAVVLGVDLEEIARVRAQARVAVAHGDRPRRSRHIIVAKARRTAVEIGLAAGGRRAVVEMVFLVQRVPVGSEGHLEGGGASAQDRDVGRQRRLAEDGDARSPRLVHSPRVLGPGGDRVGPGDRVDAERRDQTPVVRPSRGKPGLKRPIRRAVPILPVRPLDGNLHRGSLRGGAGDGRQAGDGGAAGREGDGGAEHDRRGLRALGALAGRHEVDPGEGGIGYRISGTAGQVLVVVGIDGDAVDVPATQALREHQGPIRRIMPDRGLAVLVFRVLADDEYVAAGGVGIDGDLLARVVGVGNGIVPVLLDSHPPGGGELDERQIRIGEPRDGIHARAGGVEGAAREGADGQGQ